MKEPIRVVGVGSPNGDDAVGWEVVRELRQRMAKSSGLECFEIEGGQRLLELLDGQGALILIDAIVNGLKPGTVERIEWPDPRIETLSPGSTHAIRLAEALQLGSALGLLPEDTVIFGIAINAPAHGQQRLALSPILVHQLPAIVHEIEGDLTRRARRIALRL